MLITLVCWLPGIARAQEGAVGHPSDSGKAGSGSSRHYQQCSGSTHCSVTEQKTHHTPCTRL